MKRSLVAAMLAWSFAMPATADGTVPQLWQTEAVFLQPESVLPDAQRQWLYVSNIDGAPLDKDGKGFISLLGRDGQVKTLFQYSFKPLSFNV